MTNYIIEDHAATFMARIRDNDGSYVQQSDLASVSWYVFNIKNKASAVASGSLTVADVVYDTLQTSDVRWTTSGGDSPGFNFLAQLAGTSFPDKGEYQVEFYLTPVSGAVLPVIFRNVQADEVFAS